MPGSRYGPASATGLNEKPGSIRGVRCVGLGYKAPAEKLKKLALRLGGRARELRQETVEDFRSGVLGTRKLLFFLLSLVSFARACERPVVEADRV